MIDAYRGKSPFHPAVLAGLVLSLCVWSAAAAPEREPAGTSRADKGMLFRRADAKADWQLVDAGQTLPSGDLLLAVAGTVLESKNGAVTLQLPTAFDSPPPLLHP